MSISNSDSQVHFLQDSFETGKIPLFQLPRPMPLSLALDQCCSCETYRRNGASDEFNVCDRIELSAFVPNSNPQTVALYCEGKLVYTFQFQGADKESDTILGIKLVPWSKQSSFLVPVTPESKQHDRPEKEVDPNQKLRVVVVIATLQQGLTVYSLLLQKNILSGETTTLQVSRVPGSSVNQMKGRRIQKMAVKLIHPLPDENTPIRFVVATSSSELLEDNRISFCQRIDCLTYTICSHDHPVFELPPSTLSYLGSSSTGSNSVVLSDAGCVKSMVLGEVSKTGTCTLAVLSSTELIFIQIPQPEDSGNRPARLLLAGLHPTHQLGTGKAVIAVGSLGDGGAESFAVVFEAKSSKFTCSPVQTKKMFSEDFASEMKIFDEARSTPKKLYGTIIDMHENEGISATVSTDNSDTIDLRGKLGQGYDADQSSVSSLMGMHFVETNGVSVTVSRDSETIEFTGKIRQGSGVDQSTASSLLGMDLAETQESPLIAKCLLSEEGYSRARNCNDILTENELYPDHLAHIVIVTVERSSSPTPELSTSTIISSMPRHVSVFDNLSVCRIQPVLPHLKLPPSTPGTLEQQSELMFSPSPGDNMTDTNVSGLTEPRTSLDTEKFALVCTTKNSSALHFIVFSSTEGTMEVQHEEEIGIIDKLATCSNDDETSLLKEMCSVKSVLVEETPGHFNQKDLVDDCVTRHRPACVQIRAVISTGNPEQLSDQKPDGSTRNPINISLKESTTVATVALIHQLPSSLDPPRNKQRKKSKKMPDNESGNPGPYDPSYFQNATMLKLDKMMEALERFEANMSKKMDRMEKVIENNTSRLTALELQVSGRTNQSFGSI